MWKQLGKGAIWLAIYFGLQNICSIVFAFAYMLMNVNMIPDATDVDALMDFVITVVMSTAVPALIAAAVAMIIIYLIHRKVTHQPLYIQSSNGWLSLFFVGFAGCLNVLCNFLVAGLSMLVPESWMGALEGSTEAVSTGQPFWVLILGTGILVPIMEELTFRYGLHHYIAKKNVVWGYIISSVIFGLMHGNPVQIIYATLIGFVLAYVYQKTNNLTYPIIIHAVNNTLSLISMLFTSDIAYIMTVISGGAILIGISAICSERVRMIFYKTCGRLFARAFGC